MKAGLDSDGEGRHSAAAEAARAACGEQGPDAFSSAGKRKAACAAFLLNAGIRITS